MSNDEEATVMITCIVVGLIAGLTIMGCAMDQQWSKEAVEKGYAEYHSVTGEWQWIEKVEEL